MISFYPGPSQVDSAVESGMIEAFRSGILAQNHRMEPFMNLYRETCVVIREKLQVPQDYTVIFPSSATECWEIIAQSYYPLRHHHFFNGAFGEKWYAYGKRISEQHDAFSFGIDEVLEPQRIAQKQEILCLTHNETSNGSCIALREDWQTLNPDALIAVDATSSLGGVDLPIGQADIWYASVQKCLGLPSGMAVMLLSPRAVATAYKINARAHYNSLAFTLDNARKYQTPYTPNILGIYLLKYILGKREAITMVAKNLQQRMAMLHALLEGNPAFSNVITLPALQSSTVCAIQTTPQNVQEIKMKATECGILLGNGYGERSDTTFRIANFPAITKSQWIFLIDFLSQNLH